MRALLPAVVLSLLLGMGIGAVAFDQHEPARRSLDTESPGFSLGTASGECGDLTPNAGWVHDVAAGEQYVVTLNATIVHDGSQTVWANVSRVLPHAYRIDLRTVPDERGDETRRKGPEDGECESTRVLLGTGLPTDHRRYEVSINGRTLLTVENDDTTPDLYPLPNPISANASD